MSKQPIARGAATYGTASNEEDDDPYAMRPSGSNNISPSTRYGDEGDNDGSGNKKNVSFPEKKVGGPLVQVETKHEEEAGGEKRFSKLCHRLDLARFYLLHRHFGGYFDDGSERTGVKWFLCQGVLFRRDYHHDHRVR